MDSVALKRKYGISLNNRRFDQLRCEILEYVEAYNPFQSPKFKAMHKANLLETVGGNSVFKTFDHTKAPKGTNLEVGSMMIFEVISKQDLEKVIHSFNRLQQKYHDTGYLGGTQDKINIINSLHAMKTTINNIDTSWVSLGRFSGHSNITGIDFFDFKVINLSTSFCLLEFVAFFDKETKANLKRFAVDNYKGKLYSYSLYYSGGKVRSGVRSTAPEICKQRDWFEKLALIKWSFLSFLQSELKMPLLLFEHNIPAPSVVLIDTNFASDDVKNSDKKKNQEQQDYLRSLGLAYKSQLSDSESFEFVSMNYNSSDYNTLQFLFDSRKLKDKISDGYYSIEFALTHEREKFFQYSAELELLDILLKKIESFSSLYAQKVTKLTIKKSAFSKALRLKFNYEKETNIFIDLEREINWTRIGKNYDAEWPEKSHTGKINDPKNFTHILEYEKHVQAIRNDILDINGNKIELLKSLSDVKHDKSRLRMDSITFIVSLATFLILISPWLLPKLTILVRQILSLFESP